MVVGLWWLAGTLTASLGCMPLDEVWDWTSVPQCIDFNLFWFIMGVLEIVMDTAILILPMRMVMSLHLSRRGKWILAGIFLLGALYGNH